LPPSISCDGSRHELEQLRSDALRLFRCANPAFEPPSGGDSERTIEAQVMKCIEIEMFVRLFARGDTDLTNAIRSAEDTFEQDVLLSETELMTTL